ncbi:helix-turn-helix transcriptional regulator [Pseudonocardia endophytica]|uniref:LuxR family GAF modulated transcriptional regulator n=1 Tax=Pseudonocardia endophytica TaxID=401976 RepID=A0A4R1I2M0_PSEEN|nr:helix-turn-helix transcriptional regulator [Pseudonocardia endophytica]TCK26749.1 LuxR family GAF modulated transcriptional regulator [Pseudonocardia endophytica]
MAGVDGNPPKRGALDDTLRPLIDRSLVRLRKETGTSLTFAGRVQDTALELGYFDGRVVGPLRGALLDAGHGLGGQVLVRRQAMALKDYLRTPAITHVYDTIIRAEQLRSLAAAPVIVGRTQVAVLYSAVRSPVQEFGRMVDAVLTEARLLEQSLVVADVLRLLRSPESDRAVTARRDRCDNVQQKIDEMAGKVPDKDVRFMVRAVVEELSDGDQESVPVRLTPRENDVLMLLSTGASNRVIAERLGIGVHTVKGHVKSILTKLDATSRFEAVVVGRQLDLLP